MRSSSPLVLLLCAASTLAHGAQPVDQRLAKRQTFISTATIPTNSITLNLAALEASASASATATSTSAASTSTDAATSTDSSSDTSTSAATTTTSSSDSTSTSSSDSTSTDSSSSTDTSSASKSTSTKSSSSSSSKSSNSSSSSNGSDASIDEIVVNLAIVLENLESHFYAAALDAFPLSVMEDAGLSQEQAIIITQTIQGVQNDEATHASVLSDVLKSLGSSEFGGCQNNFGETLNDPITFLSVARSLEAVGVSAYLGAASLLTDKSLLTAAGSILTIEARHQTILNAFSGGNIIPQSFDIALSANQVLTLAGGLLENCQASDLQLTAGIPLAVIDVETKSNRFQTGSQLAFQSTIELSSKLFCQMIVGGAAEALVFEAGKCIVPQKIDGPVIVFLTNSKTPLITDLQKQDTSDIAAGPALLFVDSVETDLAALFAIAGNSKRSGALASANMGGMSMNKQKGTKIAIAIQTNQNVTEPVLPPAPSASKRALDAPRKMHRLRRSGGVGVHVLGWN